MKNADFRAFFTIMAGIIVKKLDALSEKVRALRELQSAQSADLRALKQSILHEAFAGRVE